MQQVKGWSESTPVGIGSAGKFAVRGAVGLLDPASAESQARFLETHLQQLLSPAVDPTAVFVFRYRDPPDNFRGGFGLRDASGRPRPAWEVVRGFYSGTQDVFAFRLGKAPRAGGSWSLLAAWVAFAIFAVAIFTSSRFRRRVTIFATSRGYYVDQLRNDRGGGGYAGLALIALASQVLLSGSMISILVGTLRYEPSVGYLVSMMPAVVRHAFTRTLEPGIVILLFVVVLHTAAVMIMASALRLSGCSSFGEALEIIVWPGWVTAILPCLVLIIPSLEPAVATRAATAAAVGSSIPILAALSLSTLLYCKLQLQSRGSRVAMGMFCTAVISLLVWVLWFLDMVPSPSKIAFLLHLVLRG